MDKWPICLPLGSKSDTQQQTQQGKGKKCGHGKITDSKDKENKEEDPKEQESEETL